MSYHKPWKHVFFSRLSEVKAIAKVGTVSLDMEVLVKRSSYHSLIKSLLFIAGFKLTSLNKIIDTKSSVDRKLTLLHYLLDLLERKVFHLWYYAHENLSPSVILVDSSNFITGLIYNSVSRIVFFVMRF